MREAFRLTKDDLPPGFDFVLIPRPLDEHTLEAIQSSLVKLARQAVRKIERDPAPAKEPTS